MKTHGVIGMALAAALVVLFTALPLALRGARPRTDLPPPAPAPIVAATAVEMDPPVTVSPRIEVERDEPTLRAFAKLRCTVGDNRAPFLGDFEVWDDRGRVVAAGTTRNNDEVEFALPLGACSATFVAGGYRPARIDVSAAAESPYLGEVVFEPDAVLRLRLTGLPVGWRGTVRVQVNGAHCGPVDGMLDGQGAVAVPVPSGRTLAWQLAAEGEAFACALRNSAPLLASGETREVAVAVDAARAQRFRVTGVQEELLPHLLVRGRRNRDAAVRLDAAGCGELRSDVVEDAPYIDAADDIALVASLRPAAIVGYLFDEIVLRPYEPIVGVQLRAGDGALVPFTVNFGGGPSQQVAALQVLERKQLDAAAANVWSEATGGLLLPKSAWAGQGDLIVLDARAGVPTATLRVVGTGTRPRGRIEVMVFDAAGKCVGCRPIDAATGAAAIRDLGGDTIDLRWVLGGELVEWIARGVTLGAGEQRDLQAPWPAREAWTGEVAGWNELPAGRRFHKLRLGTVQSTGDRTRTVLLDRDGHFMCELEPAREPGPAATLFHALMTVDAQVDLVDRTAHHIVVSLRSEPRWVDLDLALPRSTPWTAYIVRADRPAEPWMIVSDSDCRPLIVPPGVRIAGAVTQGDPFSGGGRLFAWFTADGTQSAVRVAPAGGHWVALAGSAHSWAQAIGPDGVRGPWVHPGADGTAQLWVPDGTESVRSGRDEDAATTDHSPAVDHLELR